MAHSSIQHVVLAQGVLLHYLQESLNGDILRDRQEVAPQSAPQPWGTARKPAISKRLLLSFTHLVSEVEPPYLEGKAGVPAATP